MKTHLPKVDRDLRKWHVIDANGAVLGRLAAQVANILRGKNKPIYTPHLDAGDFVVVIKPDQDATYKNTVDILDEMTINDVKRYAMIDITPQEYQVIQATEASAKK